MKNITNTLDTLAKNHNALVFISSCCGKDVYNETCGECGEHAGEVTLEQYYE